MTRSGLSVLKDSGLDPVVADLLETLANRVQNGETIDPDQLALEYPEHAEQLLRLLPAVQMMATLDRSAQSGSFPPNVGDLDTGTLGDYRIIREVGRGGMGIVYEAEQISLNRRVALKVLPFAATMDPRQLQRFRNEAQAAACLHHPNIVPVHGVGCERGVHYYAMQLIEGRTLGEVITDRRAGGVNPPVKDSLDADHRGVNTPRSPVTQTKRDKQHYRHIAELIAQAADALEYAHSMGVVHRDIKPANLMLTYSPLPASGRGVGGEGQDCHLWVTDFGLAKLLNPAVHGGEITKTGDMIGTLRYMSPEQALARHGLVDHRADVYSLGATLYELLTLHTAVEGLDRQEILKRIAFDEPTPLRKRDKSIPAELETITLKALAKEPGERYGSAGEFADDLRRWLGDQAIKAKPPGWRERAAKWGRRHMAAVWGIAATLLILTVATALSAALILREQRRTNDAYSEARQALDELSSQVIDDWLAKQPVLSTEQRTFLDRALVHYERFAAMAATDAETKAAVAGAKMRLGTIRLRLGQLAEAETAYGQSVELYQQSAGMKPMSTAFRLNLSKAIRARGYVLQRKGKNADAEPCYQQALTLQEKLDTEDPENSQSRFELAGTLLLYGGLCQNTSRTRDAERFYRRGVEFLSSNAVETTISCDARHRLALLQSHLGGLLCSMHSYVDAEKPLRSGIEILDALARLAGTGPEGIQYREALAAGLTGLGHVLGNLQRPLEAIDVDRRAVEIRERLAADFPGVPQYRHGVAEGLEGWANHLRDLGRLQEGEPHYARAATILDRLIEEYPEEIGYRESLAVLFQIQGYQYLLARRGVDAEKYQRRALAVYEAIASQFPKKPDRTATVRVHLAATLKMLGKDAEADAVIASIPPQPSLLTALMTFGWLLTEQLDRNAEAEAVFRRTTEIKPDYAEGHSMLGVALGRQGRGKEAERSFRRAIELKPDLAEAYYNLGNPLRQQGRFREALDAYRECVSRQTKFSKLASNAAKLAHDMERLVALEAQLPPILAGQAPPADARDQVALAEICRSKKLYALSVRLVSGAIAADRKLADELYGLRYDAAYAAALASDGQGADADKLTESDRARLRRRAFEWLSADLSAAAESPNRKELVQILRHGQNDSDLASIRDAAALEMLSNAEREAWQKLWADVADLLKRSEGAKPAADTTDKPK